jgi:hypothetical protein
MACEKKSYLSALIMKTTLSLIALLITPFFYACHSSGSDQHPGKDTMVVDAANPQLPKRRHNPEFREAVKKDPVAEYKEETGRIEGDFIVKLYQTPKTMAFRVAMEYEGLPADDTVKLPDMGTEPKPVLKQGGEKFSCIIGFLDDEKQFRELKLVHGKGNDLKVTTLKHWVVTDHYRLVSQ